MEKPNIAPDLEQVIQRLAARSFLERNEDHFEQRDYDAQRTLEALQKFNNTVDIQEMPSQFLFSKNAPKTRPGTLAIQPKIVSKRPAYVSPKSTKPADNSKTPQMDPAALAVVAPFLKRLRRENIKKAIDEGNIYDKTSRVDPDLTEVPGITDKVKQKRSELIQDWNPEIQRLERYQSEKIDDGISIGGRGGIFYTPNFKNRMYERQAPITSYSSEGGSNIVAKHKKTRNPLILKRDAGDYVGEAGLKYLLGSSVDTDSSSQLASKLPAWMKGELKQIKKKEYEKVKDSDILQERILSELARNAGYDSILGARNIVRHNEQKTKTVNNKFETPVSGPFSLLTPNREPDSFISPFESFTPAIRSYGTLDLRDLQAQGPFSPLKTKSNNPSDAADLLRNYLPKGSYLVPIKSKERGNNTGLIAFENRDDRSNYNTKPYIPINVDVNTISDIPSGTVRSILEQSGLGKYVKGTFDNPNYKKPIQANQLVELDNIKPRVNAAERARGAPVFDKFIKSYEPIPEFQVNALTRDFKKLGLTPEQIFKELLDIAKKNSKVIYSKHDRLVPEWIKEEKDLHPTFAHGPYTVIQPTTKKNPPNEALYEQFLKEILERRLLKYKKEHKP
jgi:hypothetical protein